MTTASTIESRMSLERRDAILRCVGGEVTSAPLRVG
jgi:hypothetical protein